MGARKQSVISVSDPNDPKCWCREAAARMEKEAYSDAIYCYEQAVRFYPKDDTSKDAADVWFNIGSLYEKTGHLDAAAGCFAAARIGFPKTTAFMQNLHAFMPFPEKPPGRWRRLTKL